MRRAGEHRRGVDNNDHGEVLVLLGCGWDMGNREGPGHRNVQDADMLALALRVHHERHRRLPVDSEHQMEYGFHHWVRNGKLNTTKQEPRKD